MIHLDLYLEATDNEEDSGLHMQMRTALLGSQTTLKVINRIYIILCMLAIRLVSFCTSFVQFGPTDKNFGQQTVNLLSYPSVSIFVKCIVQIAHRVTQSWLAC
jgi:hypothetical protein